MLRAVRRAGAVVGLLALAAVTAFGGPATAAPGKLTVVAEGLNNPRGIGFGPDGALYVAESGSGGAGPCITSPEGGGKACFAAPAR